MKPILDAEISIDRYRELLGDESHGLSDQQLDRISRQAATMTQTLIDAFRTLDSITRAPETATPCDQPHQCRWWTARRAAAYVSAGPKEIYKAVRAGKLKALRLNQRGDIRTTREWVEEWMEQKQREQRVT